MDFFQAQDRARSRTSLLVFYFAAAVIGIVVVLYVVALLAIRGTHGKWSGPEDYGVPFTWWDPGMFAGVALGTVAVIGLGTAFKSIALRGGGSVVAESLGGVLLAPNTTDLRERRLVNVVEEMAIASGLRVPRIYLLPDERGINAFAAGWSPDDAAIAVTRGALDALTRDELQGVIAHEFSHILNGDMRLNIRLIGLLFGILLLTVVGRVILRTAAAGRRSSRGKGNPAPLLIIGAALVLVGLIGVFFGRLIQAAVSRQREYLADASSVQFTRNPAGITGALKKIGGLAFGSRIGNAHATESSHLFFANALAAAAAGPWATHPPLVERIRAIEPAFDGRFPEVALARASDDEPASATPPRAAAGRPPPLRPEQFVVALAAAGEVAPHRAAGVLDRLPGDLRDAARQPETAPALLLSLLAQATDDGTAARERAVLEQALGPAGMIRALQFARDAAGADDEARLALVDLTLPAIRQLAPETIRTLLAVVDEMISADYRTSPFELALARIVRRSLAAVAPGARPQPALPQFPKAPLPDVAALLDAVARAGADGDPAQRSRAYAAGAKAFGFVGDLAAGPREPLTSLSALALPLQRLERTPLQERARVLEALAHVAAADGVVRPEEHALLRGFAAALDCPAPLLASGDART